MDQDVDGRRASEGPDKREEVSDTTLIAPTNVRTAERADSRGQRESGSVADRASRSPGSVRAEDTEPYIGLQYVARLFKVAAMVVIVAITAEVIAGLALEGADAILPLFNEVIRGIVLAAILWGAGDLTVLMIDVGHDVRAARVLLGRISARAAQEASVRDDVEVG